MELRKGEHYHKDALKLNSARNCFEYILRARKYDKVYIPYYTCEVMLQPLHKLNVKYEFYHINEYLEVDNLPALKSNEAFLYTNYYGLKQDYVWTLSRIYKKQLIVDNAQAFFDYPIDGIDTFYSPRKFFGVPDGAYLYTDCYLDFNFEQDKSYDRMMHLLKRIDEGAESAYSDFRRNEELLDNRPIMVMSKITDEILQSIDYDLVRKKRLENYDYIDCILNERNRLKIQKSISAVPMVYPFYTLDNSLRQILIDNNIFVATYWHNVFQWCDNSYLDYQLSQYLVPLPIDQRYSSAEMLRMSNICNK